MAIRTVVTRGYGNGTYNGTIPLVVTRGYLPVAAGTVIIDADNAYFVLYAERQQVIPWIGRETIVPGQERRQVIPWIGREKVTPGIECRKVVE